jgi:hypothetical protein
MTRQADYLVIGRAENMGLGSMAEDFCRNMPADMMIVDCETGRRLHPDRFANVVATVKLSERKTLKRFVDLFEGYKAVVWMESFFDFLWVQAAIDAGAKTVGMPMYECSPPGFQHLDVLISLSDMDLECYPTSIPLRWPIDKSVLGQESQPMLPPKRFLHNAGNLGLRYRNGTESVLNASWGLYGTDVKLKVRYQERLPAGWSCDGKVVEFLPPCPDRQGLYAGADVFVLTHRYGGLSLPHLEASALGLPLIVSDIPSYAGYPHRVKAVETGEWTSPAGFRVPLFDPDSGELAEMISAMSRGNLPVEPTPKHLLPPSWDIFRKQFRKVI